MKLVYLAVLTSLWTCDSKLINISENERGTRGNATLTEAEQTCKREGMFLPTAVWSRDQNEIIMEVLQKAEVKSLWSGIVRVTSDVWTWISGKKYDGGSIASDFPHLTCATLKGTAVFASDCFSTAEGYLCQYGCNGCTGENCRLLSADGVCVECHSDRVTWFEAASRCMKINGTLLATKDSDVPECPGGSSRESLWIGLTKGPWMYEKDNVNTFLLEDVWKEGEVTEKDKRCSVIQRDGDRLVLVPVNCDGQHPYICLADIPDFVTTTAAESPTTACEQVISDAPAASRGVSGGDANVTITTMTSAASHDDVKSTMKWVLSLGVALAVLIFLTTLAVVFVCIKRHHLNREDQESNQTYQGLTPSHVTYRCNTHVAHSDVTGRGQSVQQVVTEAVYEELKDKTEDTITETNPLPAPNTTALLTADDDYLLPRCTAPDQLRGPHANLDTSCHQTVTDDVTVVTTKTATMGTTGEERTALCTSQSSAASVQATETADNKETAEKEETSICTTHTSTTDVQNTLVEER